MSTFWARTLASMRKQKKQHLGDRSYPNWNHLGLSPHVFLKHIMGYPPYVDEPIWNLLIQ